MELSYNYDTRIYYIGNYQGLNINSIITILQNDVGNRLKTVTGSKPLSSDDKTILQRSISEFESDNSDYISEKKERRIY